MITSTKLQMDMRRQQRHQRKMRTEMDIIYLCRLKANAMALSPKKSSLANATRLDMQAMKITAPLSRNLPASMYDYDKLQFAGCSLP